MIRVPKNRPGGTEPPSARWQFRERFAWAILGSAWVHVGLGYILLLGTVLAPEPGVPTPLIVLRVGPTLDPVEASHQPDGSFLAQSVLERRPLRSRPAPVSTDRPPVTLTAVRLDRAGMRPESAKRISSEDATATERARPMVLSPDSGVPTPKAEGRHRELPTDHPMRHRGTVDRSVAAGEHGIRSEDHRSGSGGGGLASHTATGSRGQADDQQEGGAAARAGASTRPDLRSAPTGDGVQSAFPVADGGAHPSVHVEHRKSKTHTVASPMLSRTDGDGIAMVEAAGEASRTDGQPDDAQADPSRTAERLDRRDGDGPGDEAGPTDLPIEELQAALGWSRPEFDSPELQAIDRANREADGARRTSPQTVVDDLSVRDFISVSALKDPLGEYIRQVEDVLYARWQRSEIPIADRARGIQGSSTVQYTIAASGRIDDVELVRSSGNDELDLLALSAVPERVPRIPRQVQRSEIRHQVVLRYRNPLIATALEWR